MEPGDIFDMGQSELDDTFKDRSTKDERAGTEKGREGLTEKDLRSIQGGLQYGRGTQINKGLDDDFVDSLGNIPKGITDASFGSSDTPDLRTQDARDNAYAPQQQQNEAGDSGFSETTSSGESFGGSGYGQGQGSYGGMGDFNIGGLASKKKQKTKVKKMKQGGLASRK